MQFSTLARVCLSTLIIAAALSATHATPATPPLPALGSKTGGHKHLEDANFGVKRWANAPHFTKHLKRGGQEFNISYVTINGVNFSEPDVALSLNFIREIELQESINSLQHQAALLEGHVESLRPSAVDLDLLGVVFSEGGVWQCPIPFKVNEAFPNEHASKIYQAIQHMEKLTRWRFDEIFGSPSESQSDYIEFMHNTDGACYSYIGRQGGRQEVHVSEWCGVGSTIHEILHAIGVFHEHTRSDRDNYVTVHFDNIESGWQSNYDISPWQTLIGSYDYGSIMHYPLGDQMTLTQGLPQDTCVVGQRFGMSKTDVLATMSRWAPSAVCGYDSSPPPYDTFCNQTTINVCGHVGVNSGYMGHYLLQGVHDGRPYYQELDGTAFLFWRADNLAWLLGNALGLNSASGYAPADVQTPDLVDAGEWRMWSGTAWVVSAAMTTRKCFTNTEAPHESHSSSLPTFAPTPLLTPLPTPAVTSLPTPLPTSYPTTAAPASVPAPVAAPTPALVPVPVLVPSPQATNSRSFTSPPTAAPWTNCTEVTAIPTIITSQGTPDCFTPNATEFEANQQWECCSPLQPCPQFVGHCRRDSDCQDNLICGLENCAVIWGSNSPYESTASCCDQFRLTSPVATESGARSATTIFGEFHGLMILRVAIAVFQCFAPQ